MTKIVTLYCIKEVYEKVKGEWYYINEEGFGYFRQHKNFLEALKRERKKRIALSRQLAKFQSGATYKEI